MAETSVAHRAHPPTPQERIARRVERELERLRAARPHLDARISRAENILVTHLACKQQRIIRVRVDCDGRARFLVNGSGGAVYVVNPSDWSCTCPDHHRRGAACKHSIACWALWRASARPATTARCASCGEVHPRRDLIEVGAAEAEHSLDAREGERYCQPCAVRCGVA